MSAEQGGLTTDDVRGATFSTPPPGQQGYDAQQVDDLLEQVAQRLEGRGGLTADDVRNVRFSESLPLTRGYREDDVDEFLDEAAETLDELDARRRYWKRSR
jgi:DivIVA domain-containing protein